MAIKLDDKDKDLNSKKYMVKGLTPAYCNLNLQKDFAGGTKVSRGELWDGEKHAVVKTFEKCID